MELNAASETQTALGLDALRSTRAIRTKVETPAEINEVAAARARLPMWMAQEISAQVVPHG